MSKLDDRVDAWVVLDDGSITQRPVITATSACAGGAHQRSTQKHDDEVHQYAPGKSTQGGRWEAFGFNGTGGSGHECGLWMEPTSVEQRAERRSHLAVSCVNASEKQPQVLRPH